MLLYGNLIKSCYTAWYSTQKSAYYNRPLSDYPIMFARSHTAMYMYAFRDELHESNIVTKAFIVDDVGPPSDDIDSLYNDEKDEDENGLLVPTQSLKQPYTANKKKVTINLLYSLYTMYKSNKHKHSRPL